MCISVAQLLSEIRQNLQKNEFFKFCIFVKKCGNYYAKLWKMRKFKKYDVLFFLVISTRPLELQRCTIPHFKAINLLFLALAWLLTPGLITFVVESKMSCKLFFSSPSKYCKGSPQIYVDKTLGFFDHLLTSGWHFIRIYFMK